MEKCEKCKNEAGKRICRYDVIGTPQKNQEVINHSEVKEGLLRLIRDSFRRSEDSNIIANISVALIGDFGMGKTTVVDYFIDKIKRRAYNEIIADLLQNTG